MVNRLKLNEKALRDAEPKAGISYQVFDTEVIGFAARIQASGARTFTIDYRHAGRQRRMNIGRWPEWSVTAARERAKELRRAIDEGHDPLSRREEFRGAPRIKDMIERYIAEHLPKLAKNNAADQTSMLKKMVEPTWGTKLVTEISKSDIARFLDFVAEGRPRPSKDKPNNRARKLQGLKPTPIRANRSGEVLRKMVTLAIEWEWRTDNPAQGFHRRIGEARERFLGPEELTRIAAVLDGAEDLRAAAIIRMCMLTGEIVAATVAGLPESLGGKRMAIYLAELARAGMTPDWMPGVVPRCVPVETKSNQHGERASTIVVGTERVLTRSKWRTVEVLACPVTWRLHPEQIGPARRGYEDWWLALDWVRDGLVAGGMLREVELDKAMPKVRPWLSTQLRAINR